jgi:hypothetical protein
LFSLRQSLRALAEIDLLFKDIAFVPVFLIQTPQLTKTWKHYDQKVDLCQFLGFYHKYCGRFFTANVQVPYSQCSLRENLKFLQNFRSKITHLKINFD